MNAYMPCERTIRAVERHTSDVFSWQFDVSEGHAFAPGQFNMIYLHGMGEVAISISGDPSSPNVLSHTVRSVGTVTQAMAALEPGDAVGIRGPYGTAWPLDAARGGDLVFVAGGLGLAPLRPAILAALRRRAEFGRVVILCGARTPEDLLFSSDLAAWRGRFDCSLEAIVDRASQSWRGQVGVVTQLIRAARFDPLVTTAFVCGPEIMMRFCARDLVALGVSPERVHLSMERSMKCAVALCGHCQWGPSFVCKDGPVFPYDRVQRLLCVREV